jgi:hypothetical protein
MVSVTEENLGGSDGYDGPLVEVNDLKMHFHQRPIVTVTPT